MAGLLDYKPPARGVLDARMIAKYGDGSTLSSYTPTMREKVVDWLARNWYGDNREGTRQAENLSNVLETVTPYGAATMAYDAGRAGGSGDYLGAGLMGAMAMVPGFHGSPAKGLSKLERKSIGRFKNPVFLAVDDGTPRPSQYAQGYAGDEGQLYKTQFDDSGVLDARTPEGRSALISALDQTYPLGGVAYLAEKGVSEGKLPGWGDDMVYRALENAGHKGAYINERPDVVSAAIFDPSIISPLEPQPQGIRAFHGSPHSFDKFSMDKIGTGEGAQAYGHGLYFAERENTARGYRNAVSAQRGAGPKIDGQEVDYNDPRYIAKAWTQNFGGDTSKAIQYLENIPVSAKSEGTAEAIRMLKSGEPIPDYTPAGHMYEVRINANPDDFLDWDKPLSEQSATVKVGLDNAGILDKYSDNLTGAELYQRAVAGADPGAWNGKREYTAQALNQLGGIPGIKYLDAGSRGMTPPTVKPNNGKYEVYWGNDPRPVDTFPTKEAAEAAAREIDGRSRNYVVFDDKLIEIVKKYGIAGASTMLGYDILKDLSPEQQQQLKAIEG